MSYEVNEGFKITDDKCADWALRTIRDEESERDRIIEIAKDQIAELEAQIQDITNKCENKTAFLKNCLAMYMTTVPHKETKTQETYQLLTGKLIFKKPSVKIIHNDEKLLQYLKDNDGAEFIKTKESVDWAEFKKNLTISENNEVIDTGLGTVIDADVCGIEEVPASFDIKINKEEE